MRVILNDKEQEVNFTRDFDEGYTVKEIKKALGIHSLDSLYLVPNYDVELPDDMMVWPFDGIAFKSAAPRGGSI